MKRGMTFSTHHDAPQSRLEQAKRLFDQGLISEDEYAKKREEILATMYHRLPRH